MNTIHPLQALWILLTVAVGLAGNISAQTCDIVVQGSPGISPNPVTSGNSITVTYTIKNQGAGSAGTSQTKIQIKNSSGTQITAPTFSESSLSAGASASRSRSVPIPSGSAAGTYTAYVILDNLSALSQSNTSNDLTPGVSFSVSAPAAQSDIVVQGTPSISPNPVTSGNSITVSYTIKNQGAGSAATSQTKVQIKNSSGTEVTAPTFSEASLSAGASASRSRSVTIPTGSPSGTYTAYVILDNSSVLNQSNTSNDYTPGVNFSVSAPVAQSDIVVQGTPSISPNPVIAGNSIVVSYTIKNQGAGDAATSQTKVQIKNSSGTEITAPTFSESSLSAGSSASRSRTVTIPSGSAAGTYTAYVILDNSTVLNQSNTSNDYTPGVTFGVSVVASQCDIVVQGAPTINPNPVTAGSAIVVTYTIKNQGGTDAGSSQTKIQIKNSSGVQITAPTFSEASVLVAASESRTRSVAIPSGSAAGTYTAYVILDNSSTLNQSNTSNDYTPGVTFSVGAGQCDIVVQGTPAISPNPVAASNNITVTYTIRNLGGASAGASQTKIQIKNSTGAQIAAPTFSEGSLAAGASASRSRTVAIPGGTPAGTFAAYVILDNLEQLSQTSAANDYTSAVLFTVANAPSEINLADLTATGKPVVNPTSIEPGQTFNVSFTVANAGQLASPAFDVRVELSSHEGLSIRKKTVSLPALTPSTSTSLVTVAMQTAASDTSGAYSVRYVIEGSKIPQSNYGNDYSEMASLQLVASVPIVPSGLVEGIDVSSGQGSINWTQVRQAGKEFAYIKATEGGYPRHPTYFNANWSQAVSAGLKVGAYHLATCLRSKAFRDPSWSEPERSAKEEAAEFVQVAGAVLKPGFLPPALDVEAHGVSYIETSPGVYVRDTSVGNNGYVDPLQVMQAEALSQWIIEWCEEVKRLSGVTPVIYMTRSYATELSPYLKNRYGLWLADLSHSAGAPDTMTWGSWTIHQYSWTGSVSGIATDVDLDVMKAPLADRLIKGAQLASRGRISVSGSKILVEVSGAESQIVSIQGSSNLSSWFDVGEVQLINGFGEITYDAGSPLSAFYFRVKPQ